MPLARIEFGIISSINTKTSTAKVKLPELDDKLSGDLNVLVPLSNGDKEFKTYKRDSLVVCVFIGSSLDRGFIIGTFFNETFKVPNGATENKRIFEYPGGAKIEIDKENGIMALDIFKELNINSPKININSDEINMNSKKINLNGDVNADKINLKNDLLVNGNTTTMKTTKTEGVRVL